jgi:hypothetical protein
MVGNTVDLNELAKRLRLPGADGLDREALIEIRDRLEPPPGQPEPGETLITRLLVRAHLLNDGQAAFRLLVRIRQLLGAESEEFLALHSDILRIISPRVLMHYGFMKGVDASLTDEHIERFRGLVACFDRLGYPWFANSGTLLGITRDASLITHDHDVDIAVLFRATNATQVVREMGAVAVQLEEMGFPIEWGANRVMRIWKLAGSSFIDVFPAWIGRHGKVFVWPHTCGELSAEDLLPLGRSELPGFLDMPVPKCPEKFLEINYGKEWRVPDPSFTFDWKRASKRFIEVFPSLAKPREG